MPQIEQVQVAYWGPLRADGVDLAVDGINVATGPNGSGKTTFLDAIKLILGVADLGRKPAEYIFDGGGDATRRADRALIKVTFANPERNSRAGRVFADAGRGCELSSRVTAICEITRERRRYAIVPGYLPWGGPGRSLESDLRDLSALIPSSHWMRPGTWSELLARAGVSRALLGVISVKQGETDKAIDGSPEALLRRVLELTGKQQTLEEFREAKTRLLDAKTEHERAEQRFEAEQRELAHLAVQAQRHSEYSQAHMRLERIDHVELPAAQHAALRSERERLTKERDGYAERLGRDREELDALALELPSLAARHAESIAEVEHLDREGRAARENLERASADTGAAKARVEEASASVERGAAAIGALDEESVAHAEQQAAHDTRRVEKTQAELELVSENLQELRSGRPIRPGGIDEFRGILNGAGIANVLLAERLEVTNAAAAEATLDDGVWALVVPRDRFEESVDLAVEHGYRLPIAATGRGSPAGALAGASGLDDALAYLSEVDLPIGAPGVSAEGLVRGTTWAAWRAPERLVLGSVAREQEVARLEDRLAELAAVLPTARGAAQRSYEAARAGRAGFEASANLPGLEEALASAESAQRKAADRAEDVAGALATIGPESGRLEHDLRTKTQRSNDLMQSTREMQPRLETYERQVADIEVRLASQPLTEEQAALSELASVEVLESERTTLVEQLQDQTRFPEEVRTELVLAHRESQERTVEEVGRLLTGRAQDLEAVMTEVDRAKQRYDDHLREVVNLLARRFREVCEQAGMEGDIERRPSDIEGEFGIDVKVAHSPGEPKRSYRSSAHSGGQRAKVSILLLLAAMGLEGSADLLIMDEHIAHLDSRNIDYVAEVMNALKDRVQFILATPTNAESTRLGWCDHQIAFYPRSPGEPYVPPVRLFTRMPEDDRRYATMGQLHLAD